MRVKLKLQASEAMFCKYKTKCNFHTILGYTVSKAAVRLLSRTKGRRRWNKKGHKNFYSGEDVRAVLEWYKMKSWK